VQDPHVSGLERSVSQPSFESVLQSAKLALQLPIAHWPEGAHVEAALTKVHGVQAAPAQPYPGSLVPTHELPHIF
jgi:hypothetical protein